MRRLILVVFLLTAMLVVKAQKQVVFHIVCVPEYTPESDTLYFCSNLNDWNLKDKQYAFQKLEDDTYRLALNIPNGEKVEYKINRGNWDSVESNRVGGIIGNRFINGEDIGFDVNIVVESWQDLHAQHFPEVVFKIQRIPTNTPEDAQMFLSGSFNDWDASDPKYALKKNGNGTYTCLIPPGIDYFEYKFTRGSWVSVESRWDGGLKSNRIYRSGMGNTIDISILGWSDLNKGVFWAQVIFLAIAIQLILTAIFWVPKKNKALLAVFLIMLINVLIQYALNDNHLVQYLTKVRFVPVFSIPLLLWLYFSEINYIQKRNRWLLLAFIVLPPMIFYVYNAKIDYYTFYLGIVNGENNTLFLYAYLCSLVLFGVQLFYYYKYAKSNNVEVGNLKKVVAIYVSVIFIAGLFYVLWSLEITQIFLINWFENIIWMMLAVGIILAQYKTITQRLQRKRVVKEVVNESQEEKYMEIAEKVEGLLNAEKLFVSHQLTVNEVARRIGTNNLYISKAINIKYGMNFNSYVNKLRLEYFINKYNEVGKDCTIMSLAYDCGFNSKSAFNRAFKMQTNKTPTEYFGTSENSDV